MDVLDILVALLFIVIPLVSQLSRKKNARQPRKPVPDGAGEPVQDQGKAVMEEAIPEAEDWKELSLEDLLKGFGRQTPPEAEVPPEVPPAGKSWEEAVPQTVEVTPQTVAVDTANEISRTEIGSEVEKHRSGIEIDKKKLILYSEILKPKHIEF